MVVGLGNPGDDYVGTRHNVGVEVIQELADRHGGQLKASRQAALTSELRIGDQRMVVAFPQTWMNRSGESVRPLIKRYGITDLAKLVVVHDELDLEPGRIKFKFGGGLAGHNGLKSIRDHIHSVDFVRCRIGVGRPPSRLRGADWVLKRPGKSDRELLDEMVVTATDAVEELLRDPVEAVMGRYNAQ